jgi:hypothetical protein
VKVITLKHEKKEQRCRYTKEYRLRGSEAAVIEGPGSIGFDRFWLRDFLSDFLSGKCLETCAVFMIEVRGGGGEGGRSRMIKKSKRQKD